METKSNKQSVPSLRPRKLPRCVLVWGLLVSLGNVGLAQNQAPPDLVVVRRAKSNDTIKRRGTIVQWQGMTLTLHSGGRNREIDNDDIVDFQTAWSKEYVDGVNALRQGKARESLALLQSALSGESRLWAKAIIRSKMVVANQLLEQNASAVEQFLAIVKEDPQSRFLHLAPVAWSGSSSLADSQAEQWINSKEPIVQIIGASWLLAGQKKAEAVKVLDELSRDIDANIKNLAIAQLWRTRTNVNARQIQVWEGIVEKMPRKLRGGPYFVLAQAQAQAGLAESAEINLMRIPILNSEQKALSAEALHRVASLLNNAGKTSESQSVLSELVKKFPQTIWAQQATQ